MEQNYQNVDLQEDDEIKNKDHLLILSAILTQEQMENLSTEEKQKIYLKTRSRLDVGGVNNQFDINDFDSRKKFFQRVIEARWKYVEKQASRQESNICQSMEKAAIQISGSNKEIDGLKICGDDFYKNHIRKFLEKHYKLPKALETVKQDKKGGKKGGKKNQANQISKDQQMKMKIQGDKVEKIFKESWQQFQENLTRIFKDDDDQSKQISLIVDTQCEFEEIKVVTLLMLYNQFKDDVKLREIIQIIETVKTLINTLQSIKGVCIFDEKQKDMCFSQTLINDLEHIYDNIFQKIYEDNQINNLSIILLYPDIVIQTRFQHNFNASGGIQLYQSQQDILKESQQWFENFIKSPKNTAKLIFYKTMVGSGKTTLVIGLAYLMLQWRQRFDKMKNFQLIFCSPQSDVRNYIGKLAFNADIPFGFMFTDGESMEKVQVSNNFKFKNDLYPVLLITSPQALAVRYSKKRTGTILFYDEPTIDTDQADPFFTKNLINSLPILPKLTILASATMPDLEKVPNFQKLYQKNYPKAEFKMIYSKEFKIGLRAYNAETGQGFIPHQYCQNKEDLQKLLLKLDQNPFLQRFYHGEVVYKLTNYIKKNFQDQIQKNNISIPDLNNLKVLNQVEITKLALETLKILVEKFSDDQIKQICNGIDQQIQPIDNLVKQQYRFDKGCLVATDDPFYYTYDKFKGVYQKVFYDNLDNFSEIRNTFNLQDFEFNKNLEKMEDQYKILQDTYLNSTKSISKEKLGLYRDEIKKLEQSIKPPKFTYDDKIKIQQNQEQENEVTIVEIKNLCNQERLAFKDYQQILGLREHLQNSDLEFDVHSLKHLTQILNSSCEVCKDCKQCYDFQKTILNQCENCEKCPICPANSKYSQNTKMCKNQNLCKQCQQELLLSCENCKNNCKQCYNKKNIDALKLFFENLPLYSLALYSHEYDVDTLSQHIEYINNGQLKYLISNDGVCYGVNMTIEHVFVENDLARTHSINTLFQLMGRAGRVGISNQGFIYFSNQMVQKMQNFLQNDEPHLETEIFEQLSISALERYDLLNKN